MLQPAFVGVIEGLLRFNKVHILVEKLMEFFSQVLWQKIFGASRRGPSNEFFLCSYGELSKFIAESTENMHHICSLPQR